MAVQAVEDEFERKAVCNVVKRVLRWSQVPIGAVFVLFGASKFYPFMPTPPIPAEAARFLGAVIETGYLWPLVGAIEVSAGLHLMVNRFTHLALVLLAPVVVHIVLYLLVLVGHSQAYGMSAVLITFFVSSFWVRRSAFKSILSLRAP